MRMRRLAVLIATAGLAGGCAEGQHSQMLHQLRSDIGVLDQRVSRLERAGLGQSSSQPAAAALPAEPAAQPQAPIAPPPAPQAPAPMLKPTKREIQQALKNAGFYQGTVDGRIGSHTREAVKEFQRSHGLKVDGVVGRQTWEQLAPYLDQSASRDGELSAAATLK